MNKSANKTQRRLRAAAIVAAFALALFGLLFLLRAPLLRSVGKFLIVEDKAVHAPVLFLHNGDADSRALHAAELYKQGMAERILLPRAEDSPSVERGVKLNDTEVSLELLEQADVPKQAVTLLAGNAGASSTWDEAQALADWLKTHPVEHILIVTTRMHSRRTRWTLRRALRVLEDPPQLVMLPADHWDFDADAWWRSERGFLFVFNEYLKLAYYHLKY